MFEIMKAGRGGWSEWVRPLPGYLAKCCDCGLIHEMQFEVRRKVKDLPGGDHISKATNDPALIVMMRVRRSKKMAKKVKKTAKKAKKTAAAKGKAKLQQAKKGKTR